MALIFPRANILTAYPIKSNLMLDYRQSFSRTAGGLGIGVDYRQPIWNGAFTSATMSEDDCLALEAELNSLDGMVRSFLAHDTRRPFPRLGPQTAAYGTPLIAAIGSGREQADISGLPANLVLSVGDYFSVAEGDKRYLFTVVQGSTASALGVASDIEFRPHLPPFIPIGRAVNFVRPACTMRIDPASVGYTSSGALLGTIAFTARQD